MNEDFEHEVDRLYGLELERFVEERSALARALRKEGRRAEAARIQELRKPTLAAWAVNQLARRERKHVDLLLDAGHRLAAAQSAVLAGGDRDRFADARERERTALRRLEQAAREILGDRAQEATRRQAAAMLRAAAVSEVGRELLARGRLTGELEPTGFDALAAVAPPPRARSTRQPTPPPRRQRTSKPPKARAVDEQGKQRKAESVARRERAAARRDAVARARELLTAARERERKLAGEARGARRALQGARQALQQAERQVETIEAAQRAAADEVEAATRALDQARADA